MAGPRVLLVAPRYSPAIGGVEWHSHMLVNGIARRGVEVEVACTDPTSPSAHAGLVDGVSVRRFPTVARDSTFMLSPSMARWLVRHAGDYDLIHAQSYHTPIPVLAALAATGGRVPLVITPHFHGTGHTPLRRVLHIPYRFAGAWAMRRADSVICDTDAERRLVESRLGLPPGTATVIASGVDPDELLSAAPVPRPPGVRTVLAVGRLEMYKGTLRTLRAVAHLPGEIHLVVVGDGSERDSLLSAGKDLGMGSRLEWHARLSRADLVAWYRTADVFVSMSSHEAFGITLLEAVVGGARVVASDIGAHRDVVRFMPSSAATLVPLKAAEDTLARAIGDALAAGRVSGAEATVPTWSGMADRTLAVYHQVLERPRSHCSGTRKA